MTQLACVAFFWNSVTAAMQASRVSKEFGMKREDVIRLCHDARAAMREVFRYYIRKFVGIFDLVAKRHRDLFAGAEIAPGRPIADTPYEDQVAMIHESIEREHGRLLERAGLG